MKPLLLIWIFSGYTLFAAEKRDTLVFNTIEVNLPIVKMGEELVSNIYDLLGYEIIIRKLPPKRSLHESNEGIVDGELGRVDMTMDNYPNLVKTDEPFALIAISAFTRKNETRFCHLDTLSQVAIGVVRGLVTIEAMTVGMDRSIANSIVNVFSMLVHKRVDAALFLPAEGYMVLKQLKYEDSISVCPVPIKTFKMHHYIHKKHVQLIKRFNQKISALKKDGTLQRMITDIEKHYYSKIVAEMSDHYGITYSVQNLYPQ
ncbi:MAG: transporter substrate-binding domain-containing protein [Fibrobacterales bacterium]